MAVDVFIQDRSRAVSKAAGIADITHDSPVRAVEQVLTVERAVRDENGNAIYVPDPIREGRKKMIVETHPVQGRQISLFDGRDLPMPTALPTGIRGLFAKIKGS